jgi:hypothetical protein
MVPYGVQVDIDITEEHNCLHIYLEDGISRFFEYFGTYLVDFIMLHLGIM